MSDEPAVDPKPIAVSDAQLESAIKDAEAGMNDAEKGMFKKLKGMFGSLKGTGRAGLTGINAIKNITRAVAYADYAKNVCLNIELLRRKPEDFKLAAKVIKRGIDVLGTVMVDFPTVLSAIAPIQLKLIEQLAQVRQVAKEEFGIEVD